MKPDPFGSLEVNEAFKKCFDLLEDSDQNVFITGRAGTGKSTFLEYFRYHTRKDPVILAPTGVAAVNIQGETIHSFFKFQPGVTLREAEKAARQSKDRNLFRQLKTIIIDEISMVRADLLDCVDHFLRIIRRSSEPFGGVQVALIGDLYQLPPVIVGEEREVLKNQYASPYFFDAFVTRRLLS